MVSRYYTENMLSRMQSSTNFENVNHLSDDKKTTKHGVINVIQMIFKAEKKYNQIVDEARKRRKKLLLQAQIEAQEEIKLFKKV